jgi:hypothetical protein
MIAVDGSEHRFERLRAPFRASLYKQAPRIDLIAIHVSIPSVPHMGLVISQEMLDNYYRENPKRARPQFERLDSVGVPYGTRWYIGPVAEDHCREG